jgi:hypothetical protein
MALGLVVTYPKKAQDDLGDEHAMVQHIASVVKDDSPNLVHV